MLKPSWSQNSHGRWCIHPLEVEQKYALGMVEAPWREVYGQSPLELMWGSPLEQVGCSISPWNMAESAAGD